MRILFINIVMTSNTWHTPTSLWAARSRWRWRKPGPQLAARSHTHSCGPQLATIGLEPWTPIPSDTDSFKASLPTPRLPGNLVINIRDVKMIAGFVPCFLPDKSYQPALLQPITHNLTTNIIIHLF